MFALAITKRCQKQIADLCAHDAKLEERLRETLQEVQNDPFRTGRKLKGYTDYIRARVDYRHRLVYRVVDRAVIVFEFNTRDNISYG
ncbi:MAG: type II toxin-antitoxin system RelE/ParE family toxin [Patescibacteria group bacterium]